MKRFQTSVLNTYARQVEPGCLSEGEFIVAEVELAEHFAPRLHEAFPEVDFGGKNVYKTALLLRKWIHLFPDMLNDRAQRSQNY